MTWCWAGLKLIPGEGWVSVIDKGTEQDNSQLFAIEQLYYGNETIREA